MALITQSNNGAAFSSLLAPFTGINNGSARLLKAISAGELATLREGDIVYVESVRDYWKWLPASVIASNDITYCAPTVVGAGAGRFERLLLASPDWLLQSAWFVDATAANDEGDGSALLPLKTDSEFNRRMGAIGKRVRLQVATSLTYLQTPANQSALAIEVAPNTNFTVTGAPTITKQGTVLTAVQVQVRTAGAELGWAITAIGLGAADVGKIAVITASGTGANVGAWARIVKDETGGKVRTAPFGVYNAATTGFTAITPQVGDTIEIRNPMVWNIGLLEFVCSSSDSTTVAGFSRVTLVDIAPTGNASSFGTVSHRGNISTVLLRGILNGLTITGPAPAALIVRGGGHESCSLRDGLLTTTFTGTLVTGPQVRTGGVLTIGSDCYFQNTNVNVNQGGVVTSQGGAFFDRATANSAITVQSGGFWNQIGAVPDWGTNNASHGTVIVSAGFYTFATKPTVNGTLGAGRESQIGGTDKLYAAVPYIEGANNATLALSA